MANPPANRRPGVDADIFQGQWVRGFDVPAGNDDPAADPCDLIVSNGKSQIDQTVSNLIFASRKDDIGQPIFVMAQGETATAPIGTINFHIGREADPNGLISGVGGGALYASYGTPGLWQLQADNTTWQKISDDLGGEDLQQTLALGNFSGGFNIVMTSGDSIVGADNALGSDGAPVQLQGGAATGAAGNGGQIIARGGDSANGVTGNVEVSTLATTSGAQSGTGRVNIFTGDSRFGGNSGAIRIETGSAGDPAIAGTAGTLQLIGGRNFNTGGFGGGGRMDMIAGQATQDGQGGYVRIFSGNATTTTQTIPLPFFVQGRAGDVQIGAGTSSGTNEGGFIQLTAGVGGSGGGPGGNILLNVGPGGGGADDGQVISNGVLSSDNIKRGTQDPNSINLAGNEGDVYQRTAGGLGQVWVNTNGSPTGWQQLAFAGDFVEAFQQMEMGYVSPSMQEFGGPDTQKYSDIGLYKGLRTVINGIATVTQGRTGTGPALAMLVNETMNNEQASLDMQTSGLSGQGVVLRNRFFATFALQTASTDEDSTRFFVGLSDNDITTQLSSDLPGGRYLGFMRSAINGNWVVVHRGGGGANFVNTGVSRSTTDGGASDDVYYFVIDATDGLLPVVRFFILDPDLQVIANITVPSNLPGPGEQMWPAFGVRTVNAAAGFVSALRVTNASITTKAATVAQGGGTGTGGLSLAQVLVNGNETGLNPILINQGSSILGVTDDNAGDGAFVSVFGGATTLATNDTGGINVGSGNAFGGGAENPGSSTGIAGFGSGFQLGLTSQGNTGVVNVISGDHLGTDGDTGDINLRSGGFFNGAAGTREQGDVNIAPGSFIPNPATVTGDLVLKGGSSNLSGIVGGDVIIMSGENNSPSGNTGDIVIETFDALTAGDSGGLDLSTGSAGAVSGDSGNLTIATGAAPGGNSGFIALVTDNAGNGAAGPMLLSIGGTTLGDGSDIFVNAGSTTDAAGFGGDIIMTPGTGAAGNGAVVVNGKLTVTGLIDPTGLQLTGQIATPVAVLPAGDGLLWVDNTAVPSRLIFRDDTGTDNDISMGGGGGGSLGSLSDVNLVGPAVGEVLTYNGAQWTNLPGAGGSPLATILGLGNVTGGTAGGITVSDSLGDRIVSDGDLVLDPSVTPGDAVVIDGLRWPEADGPAGFVLTTNGLGQLSFQPGGGGGGGSSFAEAFAQMQFGALMPPADVAGVPYLNGTGILNDVNPSAPGGSNIFPRLDGLASQFVGVAPNVAPGRFVSANPMTRLDNQGLYIYKFEISNTFGVRLFLGLTTDPSSDAMVTSDTPPGAVGGYVGLSYSTTVPDAGFVFWHSSAAGAGTRVPTGVAPIAGAVYYFALDATVPGQVRMTIYDQDFVALSAVPPIAASLPLPTSIMDVMGALMPTGGVNEALFLYSCNVVHRADLLNVLGGGGNQDLASVLGFGNETGGVAIKGSDNNAGAGGVLALQGGDSTGGGGAGGIIDIITGSPDGAGNGTGGDFQVTTASGAGLGNAGSFQLVGGTGGPLGGDGGTFRVDTGPGPGAASGDGGGAGFNLGDGGATGGDGGFFSVAAGNAIGGNGVGGRIQMFGGNGFGTGDGGAFTFTAGDGGAGGGDGGSLFFTAGTGNGGGADGTITFTGDTTITGKLNVTGLIDPTGLLLDSQGSVPFTPVGADGGIWVNNSGELIFTNAGGDLNLSTAIGGGVTWLDAMLTAGYGFLGAGNNFAGPQSYGVFGSSVNGAVSPGPPPASATIGQDSEGPFLNLAVAAAPNSEAFLGTSELQIQRDSRFKARFKFQVTSPAHTDERIFIGYTDDATQVTPNPMLAVDTPVPGIQYMGLAQSVAGFNLEFVAHGSGGAMVNVFAIPTDALVHYLEIDATATSGDVTFNLYAADGVTVEATHTEPSSFLIPDLANPLRPFFGIHTDTGTTPRSLDIYQATVVTRADVVDAVTGGGGGGGTPDLETVLTAGSTTGSNSITFSLGSGGLLSDAAVANTGAAGQPLTVVLGAGSTETGTGVAGGAGGELAVTTGPGGATDAPLADGGDGGAWNTTLGPGGDNTGGFDGGTGGRFVLTTGDGGNATVGSGAGGGGGSVQFFPGAGGDSTNDTGGRGGDFRIDLSSATGGAGDMQGGRAGRFTITGGDGGSSASGTGGDGSRIVIVGGLPGSGPVSNGDGGGIELRAGGSIGTTGDPGGITLYAGDAVPVVSGEGTVQLASAAEAGDGLTQSFLLVTRATSSAGGPITLSAGRAPVASGGDGGNIVLNTREGDGAGDDGSIHLLANGATALTGIGGGNVQLWGAPTVGTGTGARVVASKAIAGLPGSGQVAGGDAEAGSGINGGAAAVQGGAGDGVGNGGSAFISGGAGGATGDGGSAQLLGGPAVGVGNTGGDVRLLPGPGPAGQGEIRIDGPIRDSSRGVQFGTFAPPSGGGFIVPFNTVFPNVPRVVQLTFEATVADAVGRTVTVAPGSITTLNFTLNVSGGVFIGAPVVHWVAFL